MRGAVQYAPRARGVDHSAELAQPVVSARRLAGLASVRPGPSGRWPARFGPEPPRTARRSVRTVHGVLEQDSRARRGRLGRTRRLPRPGRRTHPVARCRSRCRSREGRRGPRRRARVLPAPRTRERAARAREPEPGAARPADWRSSRSSSSIACSGLPRSSSIRARQRCAADEAPAWSSRAVRLRRTCPWRRRAPANATSGPPTHAGRERVKSSTEASSIASACGQRPLHRSIAPYSARQKASM